MEAKKQVVWLAEFYDIDGATDGYEVHRDKLKCDRSIATWVKNTMTEDEDRLLDKVFYLSMGSQQEKEEMWQAFLDLYQREQYADALQVWRLWTHDKTEWPRPGHFQIFEKELL